MSKFTNKSSRHLLALLLLLTGLTRFALAATNGNEKIEGRWDASVTIREAEIPFRLDLSGTGATVKATVYNGDVPQTTTNAKFESGTLVLHFEHYLTKIVATLKDGKLEGKLQTRQDKDSAGSPFKAERYVARPAVAATNVPSIDGLWEIPYESQKGE